MRLVLWLSLIVTFYAFFGYGILLFILIKIKRALHGKPVLPEINFDNLPSCTLVVAAYNEDNLIDEKKG